MIVVFLDKLFQTYEKNGELINCFSQAGHRRIDKYVFENRTSDVYAHKALEVVCRSYNNTLLLLAN